MSQDKLLHVSPKTIHSRLYAIVILNIKIITFVYHVFYITFVQFVSCICNRTQICTNCFISLLVPYPFRYLLTYPDIDMLGQWLDFEIIQNGNCKMPSFLHQSGGSPWTSDSTLLASLGPVMAGQELKQFRMD